MECERVQDLLSDYLDGSLPETGREEVSAHLSDCRICAGTADGLEDTLKLLKNLPPVPAPPELLERVRGETPGETRPKPLWKRLFLPPHIKIPLEAAAAILVFLLAYGIQRELGSSFLRPQAARMETAVQAVKETAERRDPPESDSQSSSRRHVPEKATGRAEKKEKRALTNGSPAAGSKRPGPSGDPAPPDAAANAPSAAGAPVAQTAPPAVPAQRVSTSAERIQPVYSPEKPAENEMPFRLFAAPPSRLMRPVPHGREVSLEVAAEERPGLEERIVMAALRHGGKAVREREKTPDDTQAAKAAPDDVRIMLPAESAERFIADLRMLGTVPPEGAPAWTDFPAGSRPGTIVYTVRIRVR